LGDKIPIIHPQLIYQRLGKTAKSRQSVYRKFCEQQLPEQTVEQIRAAANKSWVLGDDRFRAKVGKRLGQPVNLRAWGGDRKSKSYHGTEKNGRV
jgi:putative transposase